jgi:hypothetical protein
MSQRVISDEVRIWIAFTSCSDIVEITFFTVAIHANRAGSTSIELHVYRGPKVKAINTRKARFVITCFLFLRRH